MASNKDMYLPLVERLLKLVPPSGIVPPAHRVWIMYRKDIHHFFGITNEEVEEFDTKREQAVACRYYPNLSREDALRKRVLSWWINDQKFMKDGMRHVIGADINYYRNKREGRGDILSWATKHGDAFHDENPQGIDYHDSRTRLENVDHISEQIYAAREAIGIHPSEREWALPPSHPRHLLSFPQEILDSILGYALILSEDVGSLSPQVITCNRSSFHYQEAHYRIGRPARAGPTTIAYPLIDSYRVNFFEGGPQSFKITELSDANGPYIQLQRILRRAIDASCLRACKAFYEFGTEMLYRQNTFTFDMTDFNISRAYREQHCLMLNRDGPHPDLSDIKPKIPTKGDGIKDSYRQWLLEVEKVVSQVKQPVSDRELKGWAYNDPFIRFLFVIGAQNAALIKTLQFSGSLKSHKCNPAAQQCKDCGQGFVSHFMVCLQFIREFCTSLEKLVLNIRPDTHGILLWDEQLRWFRFQRTLTPILEVQIRKLRTVKTLVLCTQYEVRHPADEVYRYLPMNFPLAVETCQWFEDRARNWASNPKPRIDQ